MERIYMDNAATTRVTEPVMEAMRPYFCEIFGNPMSIHSFGRESRKAVEKARGQVAAALNAQPNEIYFTGCGTESDNWAIRGAAHARKSRGNHIITTQIEHHAVLHTCEQLEREGFIVSMTGKGSFVAGKDLEFVREEHLRQIEELMGRIVELAAGCDLSCEELVEMLRLTFEGD